MIRKQCISFYEKYETEDLYGNIKIFEPKVKYTITGEDLSFYYSQGCKITNSKGGVWYDVQTVHTEAYRD